jgi:hypothetical protein
MPGEGGSLARIPQRGVPPAEVAAPQQAPLTAAASLSTIGFLKAYHHDERIIGHFVFRFFRVWIG